MKSKSREELAICGISCVKVVERAKQNSILRLFIREDRAKMFGGLCKAMAQEHRFYKIATDEELVTLCGTPHNEGVVAFIEKPKVKQIDSNEIDKIVKNGKDVVVCCNVGNDHNFGAIVRSVAFFGIENVITTDNIEPFTTASYRSSVGSIAHTNIYTVNDVKKLLSYVNKKALTIATVTRSKIAISDIRSEKGRSRFIVMGNEENGIDEDVLKECRVKATIQKGNKSIESLNVAQSCAVVLYELTKVAIKEENEEANGGNNEV